MWPLEVARRALQLTRIEDLAASTLFLTADDDKLLSAASLLFLWCMGLGGFRTLTSVGHQPFVDIGLCLLYCSHLPALTSCVLLFVAICVLLMYWRDTSAWPNQVHQEAIRTIFIALYLVAVVAHMTWENRDALWGNPWAMAAITGVTGIFVERFKTGQGDAYGGYDAYGDAYNFYGTYTFYGTYNSPSTASWLLLHAILRHAQSYFESRADIGLIDGTTRIGSFARNVAYWSYYLLTTCIYGFGCLYHVRLISSRSSWVRMVGAMAYPLLHRERF